MVRSTVSLTRAHSVEHFPLLTLRRACEKYGLFKFSRNVASTIAAATQSKFWGATPPSANCVIINSRVCLSVVCLTQHGANETRSPDLFWSRHAFVGALPRASELAKYRKHLTMTNITWISLSLLMAILTVMVAAEVVQSAGVRSLRQS
jgi:hypothetical protein